MKGRSLFCILTAMLLIVPGLLIVGGEEEEPTVSRNGSDLLTLRSDSQFFDSAERTTDYNHDINQDGVKDVIITCWDIADQKEDLYIIDLKTGNLLFKWRAKYENIDYWVKDCNDDGAPDLIIADFDYRYYDTELFIIDPRTGTPLLYRPFEDARYFIEFQNNDMLLHIQYGRASYVDDYTYKLEVYSLSDLSKVWETQRYKFGSRYMTDLDGDGLNEIMLIASWDAVPTAHLLFIDVDQRRITMNSTDFQDFHDYDDGRSYLLHEWDVDDDGERDIFVHGYYNSNGTSKVVRYSTETNSSIWSTRNLGNYELDDRDHRDVNGDGVKDLILICDRTDDDKDSRLIIIDSVNGDVLMDEKINGNFYRGRVFTEDFTGDGKIDVLFYNQTQQYEPFNFRLLNPSNSWQMVYNITIEGVIWDRVYDYDHVPGVELLLLNEEVTLDGRQLRMVRYDPSDMSTMFEFGPFEYSDISSSSWRVADFEGPSSISGLTIDYRENSGNNYTQLHLMNHTSGELEFSSRRVSSKVDSEMNWQVFAMNNRGDWDIMYSEGWIMDSTPGTWMNMTLIDGTSYQPIWSSEIHKNISSWNTYNYSVRRTGTLHLLNFYQKLDGIYTYTMVIFDKSGINPVEVFRIKKDASIQTRDCDIDVDGELEIEIYYTLNGTCYFEYYELNSGAETSHIRTMEFQGSRGSAIDYNPKKDDDILMLYRLYGPSRYIFYNSDDLDVPVTQVDLVGGGNSFSMDLDLDGTNEMFIYDNQDFGTTGATNYTLVDLEDGSVQWELRGINYSISVDLFDIDDNRKWEMILIKEQYWERGYESFGVSVYNISMNLKPELISPFDEVPMTEDGPSVEIALNTHIIDPERPVKFYVEDPDSAIEWRIENSTNTLTLTPAKDAYGVHSIFAHAQDDYWDIPFEIVVNITPVNDPPRILNISGSEPDMGEMHVAVDQEIDNFLQVNILEVDDDPVTFEIFGSHERLTIDNNTGEMMFHPIIEDGLTTNCTLMVTDPLGESDEITVFFDIEYFPHPPMNVEIISPADGATIHVNGTFIGTAEDIDIPWGDSLTFSWSSDVDGHLGNGSHFNFTDLSVGVHNITLEVTDSDGLILTDMITIVVDPVARYPLVNLIGPADGSEFDDADGVQLEWELVQGGSGEVYFDLYISKVLGQVELRDQTIKTKVMGTTYYPDFLERGTYYWTVIPVVNDIWVGLCNSGIWTFEMFPGLQPIDFMVETEDKVHRYDQGQIGIPLEFEITNDADVQRLINIQTDLKGVADIVWKNIESDEYLYSVNASDKIDVVGLLYIDRQAVVGTHELTFYFVDQYGVNISVSIEIEVLPFDWGDDDDDDIGSGDDDKTFFERIGTAGTCGICGLVIFVLILLAVILFLVFSRRSKASEEGFEE